MTQSIISVEGVRKVFTDSDGSEIAALDDINLEVPEGEFLVLLGPSGCGKTTLLRCLAGLEKPTSGTITIGGLDVAGGDSRSAARPSVGMVFQNYALWPHMTVEQNISYPLKCVDREHRLSRDAMAERVSELISIMRLDKLAKRRPNELSGGQQQRVALARAVAPGNQVVLFDEPLSNIDAKVRELLRQELHAMQRRLGFTAVYVTHDQTEALDLADRMVLMREGRVVQVGSSEDVYKSPASTYVADFVGTSNVLTVADVLDSGPDFTVLDSQIGPLRVRSLTGDDPSKIAVSSRAHSWWIRTDRPADPTNAWQGTVESHTFLGWYHEYVVVIGGHPIRVWSMDEHQDDAVVPTGSEVWIGVAARNCSVVADD